MQSAERTSAVTQEPFDQVLLGFAQEFPCPSRADVFLSLKSVTWRKSCMPFKNRRRSFLYNRYYATFREDGKGAVLRDCSHPPASYSFTEFNDPEKHIALCCGEWDLSNQRTHRHHIGNSFKAVFRQTPPCCFMGWGVHRPMWCQKCQPTDMSHGTSSSSPSVRWERKPSNSMVAPWQPLWFSLNNAVICI